MSNLESVLSFVGGEHRARRESFGYWIREAFCRTFQFICRQLRVDGIGRGNSDTLECRFGKEGLKCAECALGAWVLYFGRQQARVYARHAAYFQGGPRRDRAKDGARKRLSYRRLGRHRHLRL